MSILRSLSKSTPVVLNHSILSNDAPTERGDNEDAFHTNMHGDKVMSSEERPNKLREVVEIELELENSLVGLHEDYRTSKQNVLFRAEEALRHANYMIDSNRNDAINRIESQYEMRKQELERSARQRIWLLESRARKAAVDSANMKFAQQPLLKEIITRVPLPCEVVEWAEESLPDVDTPVRGGASNEASSHRGGWPSPRHIYKSHNAPFADYHFDYPHAPVPSNPIKPVTYNPTEISGRVRLPVIYKKPYIWQTGKGFNIEKLENSPP